MVANVRHGSERCCQGSLQVESTEKGFGKHKLAIESRIEANPVRHPLLAWSAERVADIIGSDGKTEIQGSGEKTYEIGVTAFGSLVMFCVCGIVQGVNMNDRWLSGLLLKPIWKGRAF